ncbi:helix-turn-helix domain-containing protein [Nostoc sp. CHAB 5834]|nr:helix-turn-helix domain-containing protein [Nostoc sp. CHAB 5834]
MQKQTISFDQLPAAIYQLSQDVSELKRLLTEQTPNIKLDYADKPLSVTDAANFLGISKQTVYQNIGKIPHTKRFGRLYFYPADLRAYLNAGEGVANE